jgi:hypothetical protein
MSRNEVQIELSRAQYAHYAHEFFRSICVSVANKGSLDQIPKLEVAGSIPVARSIFLSNSQTQFSKVRETLEPSRKRPANFSLRNYQPLGMTLATDFKNVGDGIP